MKLTEWRHVSYLALILFLAITGCETSEKSMKKESPTTRPSVEIIAHRGSSGEAPENTLAAVQLAWRQNTDAVEVDVHASKDGQIVVIHDGDTNRVAGVPKPVAEQTLAELQSLDVGAWKDPKFAGEKIPTLADVLRTIPDGKRMFVEVKCGPEILPELRRVVDASRKTPEQIVFIGDNLEVCAALKQAFPRHRVFYIFAFTRDPNTQAWTPPADDLTASVRKAGLDGLDLDYTGPIDGNYVQTLRSAGLELYVWTVDDLAAAQTLAKAGVAGITTNLPEQVRNALTEAP